MPYSASDRLHQPTQDSAGVEDTYIDDSTCKPKSLIMFFLIQKTPMMVLISWSGYKSLKIMTPLVATIQETKDRLSASLCFMMEYWIFVKQFTLFKQSSKLKLLSHESMRFWVVRVLGGLEREAAEYKAQGCYEKGTYHCRSCGLMEYL